jgi:hypothetical protein
MGRDIRSRSTIRWRLAVRTSKTAVQTLMRVAWRTVGAIVARVAADAEAGVDRWAGPASDRHR